MRLLALLFHAFSSLVLLHVGLANAGPGASAGVASAPYGGRASYGSATATTTSQGYGAEQNQYVDDAGVEDIKPLRTIPYAEYERLRNQRNRMDAEVAEPESFGLNMPPPPSGALYEEVATLDETPMMLYENEPQVKLVVEDTLVKPIRVMCPEGSKFDEMAQTCIGTRASLKQCPRGSTINAAGLCASIETVPGDYSCPEGQLDQDGVCTTVKERLECPNGFVMDDNAKRCSRKSDPKPHCPDGFSLNGRTGDCVKESPIEGIALCPEGMHLKEDGRTCSIITAVPPQCPAGFSPKAAAEGEPLECIRHLPQVPGDCPKGYSIKNDETCVVKREFEAEKTCVGEGYRMDENEGVCLKATKLPPTCTYGYSQSLRYRGMCEKHSEPTALCPIGTDLIVGEEGKAECVKKITHQKYLKCRNGYHLVDGKCKRVERTAPELVCPEGELIKSQCVLAQELQPTFTCPSGFDLTAGGDVPATTLGEDDEMPDAICSKLVKDKCSVKAKKQECATPDFIDRFAKPLPQYAAYTKHATTEDVLVLEQHVIDTEGHMMGESVGSKGYTATLSRPFGVAQKFIKRFLLPEDSNEAGEDDESVTTASTKKPAGGRGRTTTARKPAAGGGRASRSSTTTKKPGSSAASRPVRGGSATRTTTKKTVGAGVTKPGRASTTTQKPSGARSAGETKTTTKKPSSGTKTTTKKPRVTTTKKAAGGRGSSTSTSTKAAGSSARTKAAGDAKAKVASATNATKPAVASKTMECVDKAVSIPRNCTKEQTQAAKLLCPEDGKLIKKDGLSLCQVDAKFEPQRVCTEGDKDENDSCVRILFLPAEYYCPVGEDAGGMICIELEKYPANFACPQGLNAEKIDGDKLVCVERVPDTPQPPHMEKQPVRYICPRNAGLIGERCVVETPVKRPVSCPAYTKLTFGGTCVESADPIEMPPKEDVVPAQHSCPEGAHHRLGECYVVENVDAELGCIGEVVDNYCVTYAEPVRTEDIVIKTAAALSCPEGTTLGGNRQCLRTMEVEPEYGCPAGFVPDAYERDRCIKQYKATVICPANSILRASQCILKSHN